MQPHLAASEQASTATPPALLRSLNRVPSGPPAAEPRGAGRCPRDLTIMAVAVVVFASPMLMLHAQDDADLRTAQAMCRAGLADSAIAYVAQRRELVREDRGLAAKWTMLLMECHAQAGLFAGSDADDAWEQCRKVFTEFIQRDPDNPRQPWLQWSLARCELLRAQADTAQYLSAPANAQPREQALSRIRQILTELEALEDDLKQRQPLAAREGMQGGSQAPAKQLAALAVDVGLLRCESLLLRMRLYPRGSADRIASATEVEQQARAILQRTEPDWASRAQLQVAAATARLELGQESAALRELEQLAISADNRQARRRSALTAIEEFAYVQPAQVPPASQAASQLSTRLSRGHALLDGLRADGMGPEVELASLQLSLAAVSRMAEEGQQAEKQAALQALVKQSQQLGSQFGAYWQRRAEALMVGPITASAGDDSHTMSADLMMVAVRQLLAAGDAAAAVERLLAFRDHEAAAGRGESALRSASQAAAVLQQQHEWVAAADAITSTSRQFADLPAASEAHRQAIFYWSQALRAQADDPQLAERYTQMLKEQLSLWPEAAASDEVAGWLSQWLTQAGKRSELADVWLQRAVACTDANMAEQALLAWLGEVLHLDNPTEGQRQLTSLQRLRDEGQLAVSAAKSEALQWVASVTAIEPTDEHLRQAAQTLSRLQVESDAGAWGELALAVRWLWALRQQLPVEQLSADLLQWQPARLPTIIRQGLAPPLIAAIDETPVGEHAKWAQRMQLGDDWRGALLESRSPRVQASGYRLLAWSVDASAGLEGLEALSHKAGRAGGPLQLEMANALADSGPNRWQQSSALAKTIVANSPAGSQLNWQARWRLVKNHLQQRQVDEARAMAQLWLATAPADAGLWIERFERVLSEPPGSN